MSATSPVSGQDESTNEAEIGAVCESTEAINLTSVCSANKEIESICESTRTSAKRTRSVESRIKCRIKGDTIETDEPDRDEHLKIKRLKTSQELPDYTELNFYDSAVDRRGQWFGSFDLIRPQISKPNSELPILQRSEYKGLKRLKILNTVEINFFRFENLSNFDQLEHLEFEIREKLWSWDGRIKEVSLPSLKAMCANFGCEVPREIIFNCPKLTVLEVQYRTIDNADYQPLVDKVKLADPSTIRQLSVAGKFKLTSLQQYTNVERFHYAIEDLIDSKHSEIINSLKNLKTLELGNYSEFKSVPSILNEIQDSKHKLNKDLTVYFNSVLLDRLLSLSLTTDDYKPENELRLQMNNFDYLNSCVDCTYRMYYSELYDLIKNETPSDFHSKYKSIEEVYVTKEVIDVEHIGTFLENCPNLKKFAFIFTTLNQKVLNRLVESEVKDRIVNLELTGPSKQYDFDFLLELSNLAWFSTNQKIQKKVIAKLDSLKHLEYFKFTFNKSKVEIYVSDNRKYTLMKGTSERMEKYLENGLLKTLVSRLK